MVKQLKKTQESDPVDANRSFETGFELGQSHRGQSNKTTEQLEFEDALRELKKSEYLPVKVIAKVAAQYSDQSPETLFNAIVFAKQHDELPEQIRFEVIDDPVFGGKLTLYQKDDLFRWLAGKEYIDRLPQDGGLNDELLRMFDQWQDAKKECNDDELDSNSRALARIEKREKKEWFQFPPVNNLSKIAAEYLRYADWRFHETSSEREKDHWNSEWVKAQQMSDEEALEAAKEELFNLNAARQKWEKKAGASTVSISDEDRIAAELDLIHKRVKSLRPVLPENADLELEREPLPEVVQETAVKGDPASSNTPGANRDSAPRPAVESGQSPSEVADHEIKFHPIQKGPDIWCELIYEWNRLNPHASRVESWRGIYNNGSDLRLHGDLYSIIKIDRDKIGIKEEPEKLLTKRSFDDRWKRYEAS